MLNLFIKVFYQVFRLILQLFNPMTHGVRALMVRDDQVLLVRHIYEDKWYLPGGLVERGVCQLCRKYWHSNPSLPTLDENYELLLTCLEKTKSTYFHLWGTAIMRNDLCPLFIYWINDRSK